jgi:hypothetical protein
MFDTAQRDKSAVGLTHVIWAIDEAAASSVHIREHFCGEWWAAENSPVPCKKICLGLVYLHIQVSPRKIWGCSLSLWVQGSHRRQRHFAERGT